MRFIKFTIAFLILASSLIFLVPFDVYYVDLIQSFTFHALLIYLVVTLFFTLLRWKYVAFCGVGVSLMLAVHLLPHFSNGINNEYEVHGKTIKVAHFNVLGSNRHFEEIISNAINLDVDVLSFQEVEKAWAYQLMDGLEDKYPYFAITDHKVHGVAIFSKHPLKDLQTYHWTGEPTLTGDIMYEGKTVHFVATHTLSPRNAERFENRNKHLDMIANYVNQLDGPVLAIGDFNAVPWSKSIVNIKENTDLIDSRKGVIGTYPANYSIGLPIDYIFHSNELNCLNFEALDAKGSDHKGVLGEYSFTTPELLVDIN